MNTSLYFNADSSERKEMSIPNIALVLLLIPLVSWCALNTWRVFAVPPGLRHLPRVSILKLLWSYAKVEPDDVRAKRLIMPFVEKGEELVVIWTLGRWIIHILSDEVATKVFTSIDTFPKETPPDAMLFWRLLGKENVFLANGTIWRQQSAVVRGSFDNRLPIETFNTLSRDVVEKISESEEDDNGVDFSDISQKYALEVISSALLGMELNCLKKESEFVSVYNTVMRAIANPLYLVFPWLEITLPRKALHKKIDWFRAQVGDFVTEKDPAPPGGRKKNLMTMMIDSKPPMSKEVRSNNMVGSFIAGHETSTGAICSLAYYLARFPEVQEKCRAEAQQQLRPGIEPSQEDLKRLPFLDACIKETLRINSPATFLVPRVNTENVTLGRYHIPEKTSMTVNLYAIHHNPAVYPDPYTFRPERHLEPGSRLFDKTSDWLPFARGPKQCPARVFALYEQKALLTALLAKFLWYLPPDSPHLSEIKNGLSPFSTIVPEKMMICFKPLKQDPLPLSDSLTGLSLVLSEMGGDTLREFSKSSISILPQDKEAGGLTTLLGWKWLTDTQRPAGLHRQLMRDVLQCARIYHTIQMGKPKEVVKGLKMTVTNPSDAEDLTSIGPKTLGGTAWKANPAYSALLNEGEWNGSGFPPIGPCTLFIYLGLQKKIISQKDALDCAALQMLSTVDYDFDLNEANNRGFAHAIGAARKGLKGLEEPSAAPLTGATLAAMLSFDLQKEVRNIQQEWCTGKYGASNLGPADIAPADWVGGTVADCAGLCPFGYQGEAEYIKSKTGMFAAMVLANTHDLMYDIGSSNRMSSVMYADAAGVAKDDLHCIFVKTILDQTARRVSQLREDERPLYGDSALLVTAAWAPFNGRYRTWERVVKYHRQLTRSSHARTKLVLENSGKDRIINNLTIETDTAEQLWKKALNRGSLAHVQSRKTVSYTTAPAIDASSASWESVFHAPGVPAPPLCTSCECRLNAIPATTPAAIASPISLAPEIIKSDAVAAAARIALAGRWAMTPECCAKCSAQIGRWADRAAYIVLIGLMQAEPVMSSAKWLLQCYAVWCAISSPISVATILSGFDLLGEFKYEEGAMGSRDVVDC